MVASPPPASTILLRAHRARASRRPPEPAVPQSFRRRSRVRSRRAAPDRRQRAEKRFERSLKMSAFDPEADQLEALVGFQDTVAKQRVRRSVRACPQLASGIDRVHSRAVHADHTRGGQEIRDPRGGRSRERRKQRTDLSPTRAHRNGCFHTRMRKHGALRSRVFVGELIHDHVRCNYLPGSEQKNRREGRPALRVVPRRRSRRARSQVVSSRTGTPVSTGLLKVTEHSCGSSPASTPSRRRARAQRAAGECRARPSRRTGCGGHTPDRGAGGCSRRTRARTRR